MKAFQFKLERVLEWHAAQLSVEEAKLSQLRRELVELDASVAFLEESRIDAETTLQGQVCLAGSDLEALDAYLRHARKQEENLRAQRLDTGKRIAVQLEHVLSAQRRHRLIEKLRERRHREWTTALNTEVEQLAADTYLAKFNRED